MYTKFHDNFKNIVIKKHYIEFVLRLRKVFKDFDFDPFRTVLDFDLF